MNNEAVEVAIRNLEVGLYKYERLVAQLQNTNVAEDADFQRRYNAFFRMQRRTKEFYLCYFSLLESMKKSKVDFAQILKIIYEKTNRVEASFSSKMLSMIEPNCPVWDKYVLQNLGLKAPYSHCENRIDKTVDVYHKIVAWYKKFITTEAAFEIVQKFNNKYPMSIISDVKKIDLILWQMR